MLETAPERAKRGYCRRLERREPFEILTQREGPSYRRNDLIKLPAPRRRRLRSGQKIDQLLILDQGRIARVMVGDTASLVAKDPRGSIGVFEQRAMTKQRMQHARRLAVLHVPLEN